MFSRILHCLKSRVKKLPTYVEHGGELSFPGPIVVEDAALNCFSIKVDSKRISALLDKTFAAPSGGKVRYVPITNYAFVVLGDMPKLYSSTVDVGWTSEKELTIWILAGAVKENSRDNEIERLVLFPAYVVADDPYSLASGREALGFFKSWGELQGVESTNQSPDSLSVSVFAHKQLGDKAAHHALLSFQKIQDSLDEHLSVSSFEDISKLLLKVLRERDDIFHADCKLSWELFENLFLDMWKSEFPIALLKQIRASGQSGAVYQAILESNSVIKKFRGFQDLGRFKFSFESLQSYRLDETLGLQADDSGHQGFRVLLDFQIDGGKEIWKA